MPTKLLRLCLVSILLVSLALPFSAQVNSPSGFVLNDAAVVNTMRNEVYFTNADNKVEAVSLADGQSLWTSKDNMKPLVIVSGKLLCQGMATNQPEKLVVFSLDLTQKGKSSLLNTLTLPAGVKNNFIQSENSSFTLQAAVSGRTTFFQWVYDGTIKQNNPDSVLPGTERTVSEKGFFRNQLPNKSLIKTTENLFPKNILQRSILADKPITFTEKQQGVQFNSKDDKHILISDKTSSDSVFNNYRWQIFDKTTQKRIGEMANYRSYAPFCVIGRILIYESGPYLRRSGNDIKETPLQIIAVDLDTGKQVWTKQIMDFIYRGPFPS